MKNIYIYIYYVAYLQFGFLFKQRVVGIRIFVSFTDQLWIWMVSLNLHNLKRKTGEWKSVYFKSSKSLLFRHFLHFMNFLSLDEKHEWTIACSSWLFEHFLLFQMEWRTSFFNQRLNMFISFIRKCKK